MVGVTRIKIQETVAALEALLQQQAQAHLKEWLQVLYLYQLLKDQLQIMRPEWSANRQWRQLPLGSSLLTWRASTTATPSRSFGSCHRSPNLKCCQTRSMGLVSGACDG